MKFPELRIGCLKPFYPIIQGGMAFRVSTAPLVAAVADAGGIGVIGASGMTCCELKEEIRLARSLSRGIIGVNIMYAVRNFADMVKAAIEERIDVIFTGAGFSRDIFGWVKDTRIPVVSIVSSAKLAKIAEKLGASAIVAEGTEAGGHLGTQRPLEEILPEIASAVSIPVIAAGGITDGKDMGRMFNLGAKGVQMATRFVLSKECAVAQSFKELYLKAKPEDVIIVPSPVGLPGRALKNDFIQRVLDGKEKPKECNGCLKSCSKDYCIMKALDNARRGFVQSGVVFAGKHVYKIKDILSVQAIFRRLVNELNEIQ